MDYKFSIRSNQDIKFLCNKGSGAWLTFPWIDSRTNCPDIRGSVFKTELLQELFK